MKRGITRRVFVAGAAMVGVAHKAIAQNQPLKIGFLMPLTGGAGRLGQMMLEGSQLAIEEVNGAGGIKGRKVELITEDSQALARNGIDGYRKLADVDGVPIIITGWTTVSVAIAPLATQSKVYLLSGSTASPAVRGLSPYFQSTWMYDDESVRLILPYARNNLKVDKLGVLTVISDLGAALSSSIKQEWQKLGGSAVIEENHQIQEANFRPMLLKMLAEKPDAIYITTSVGKQAAQLVRQARDLGYEGYFLSYGAFEDPEIQALGAKADKCFYSSPKYDAASADPTTKAFVDSFSKKLGRPPNVHQANHYDLIKIIQTVSERVMDQSGQLNGEAFRAALVANYPQYSGVGGLYRFNFSDGSVLRSSVVKTVKDGVFVTLSDLN
jgi:ABC-type branched-subunit amino acid transport system substrate-binding protein